MSNIIEQYETRLRFSGKAISTIKSYLHFAVRQHNPLWHPHLLRHAGATHYYLDTGDLIGTSRKLGHNEITTTMIYLSLKREDLVMHNPSPYPLLINGSFVHNN